MPGKPFQSSLIPYQEEISALRSRRPPVSYARIADLLRQKYGLSIKRAAIGKFVKSRSGGRKVYFFKREVAAKKSAPIPGPPAAMPATTQAKPRTKFQFTPSNRYNLTRLPPDEAAAIRKKLEAEGH